MGGKDIQSEGIACAKVLKVWYVGEAKGRRMRRGQGDGQGLRHAHMVGIWILSYMQWKSINMKFEAGTEGI